MPALSILIFDSCKIYLNTSNARSLPGMLICEDEISSEASFCETKMYYDQRYVIFH